MTDLIKRLRDTASKGVSVWGDLQMEAAKEIEILTAEREAYASAMDAMKASNPSILTPEEQQQLADTPNARLVLVRNTIAAVLSKLAGVNVEPVTSDNPDFMTIPVEYQYAYPDGTWRCSNGDAINGMKPTAARALYARKDSQ